jgi:hypothetical protein
MSGDESKVLANIKTEIESLKKLDSIDQLYDALKAAKKALKAAQTPEE